MASSFFTVSCTSRTSTFTSLLPKEMEMISPSLTLADAFAGLMTWHRWEDLLTLAHLAVALRPGFAVEALPAPLQTLWHTRQAADFPNQSAAGRIRPLLLPPADISATAIRAALSQDHAVDDLVDARVLDYLRTARLYQTESRKIAP